MPGQFLQTDASLRLNGRYSYFHASIQQKCGLSSSLLDLHTNNLT